MNSIAVIVFSKKENRTPALVMLSGFAVTDACIALCIVIVDILPYIAFHSLTDGTIELLWNPDFTECIVYAMFSTMKAAFHMISVLFIMSLCINKSPAILFPVKGRYNFTKKFCVIWSVIASLKSFVVFSLSLWMKFISILMFKMCVFLTIKFLHQLFLIEKYTYT